MNARQKLHQVHFNEWVTRFAEQKAAGLTNKEYCELHHISIHIYNYWKRVLKEQVVDHMLPDIVLVTLPSTIPNAATSIPTQSFTHNRANRTTNQLTISGIAIELASDVSEEFLRTCIFPPLSFFLFQPLRL